MDRRTTALFLAAAAGVASAFTTFLLWFLPQQYASPASFEEALALHETPAYMARLWVNYVHVFLALAAYGGVAALTWRRAPAAAGVGFVAFSFWALAEMLIVSINIWAVNGAWRAGYAEADPQAQELIRASIHTFDGIWDGVFFVILTTFLIATLAYAIALFRGGALQRTLSALFFLAAPLTLIIMLDGYFGASLSGWISWSYPILQPASRFLLGVWIFLSALEVARSKPDG